MMLAKTYEVIESDVIEMDPCITGFSGVLRELVYDGESYHYRETTLLGGDTILSLSSKTEALPRARFERACAASATPRPSESRETEGRGRRGAQGG